MPSSAHLPDWLSRSATVLALILGVIASGSGRAHAKETATVSPPAALDERDIAGAVQHDHEHTAGGDGLALLRGVGHGFVAQALHLDSVLYLAGAAGVTALLLATEKDFQENIEALGLLSPAATTTADVMGIATSAGIAPIAAYLTGRILQDEKLILFSLELGATWAITQLEIIALSQIPIHERPIIERGELDRGDQPFFNSFFRGRSSLPSGHASGAASLAFKAWEWYGWKAGVPATLLAGFLGYARVEDGQHYVSDIFLTFALAGVASLATSRVRHLWSLLHQQRPQEHARAGADLTLMPGVTLGGLGLKLAGSF